MVNTNYSWLLQQDMARFILAILLFVCIQTLIAKAYPKTSKEKKNVASIVKQYESYAEDKNEAVKDTDTENQADESTENRDEESEEPAEENAISKKTIKVSKRDKLTYITRVILHTRSQFKKILNDLI